MEKKMDNEMEGVRIQALGFRVHSKEGSCIGSSFEHYMSPKWVLCTC